MNLEIAKREFEAALGVFVGRWHRAGLHRLDNPGAMRRALGALDAAGVPGAVRKAGLELLSTVEAVRRAHHQADPVAARAAFGIRTARDVARQMGVS